jgi:peptidoglycan/LPS O-acetylase OafA/YrhL
MKKLELIDYLKGYSIFTIVLMHLIQNYLSMPNIINKGSSLGGAGVHVFILCSGFGLFYSYLNKPLTYQQFFKKRFSKIYVPYIIVIVISSIFPFMYSYSDRLIAVLSHIFLFKMFITKYEASFGIQFWFISTIIQFYIIFNPLVILKKKFKSDKKFFGVSLTLSIVWWMIISVIGKSDLRIWNSFFLQYLWEFSLGMLIAQQYYKNNFIIKLPKKTILLIVAIIGLILTGFSGIAGGLLKVFNDIPSLFGYGALAILIYSMNINLINKFFIIFSKFSYELYLVHLLIFSCTFYYLKNSLPTTIVALLSFFISILVAKVYNIILMHFRNLSSKRHAALPVKTPGVS